jgi:hypothetical protein
VSGREYRFDGRLRQIQGKFAIDIAAMLTEIVENYDENNGNDKGNGKAYSYIKIFF